MNKWICSLFTGTLTVACLYVGVGGWVVADLENQLKEAVTNGEAKSGIVVYDGVPYASVVAARKAIEERQISRFFAWVFTLPASLPYLLSALAFGFVGGTVRVLRSVVSNLPVGCRMILFIPILGSLTGLMILGITYILPATLTADSGSIRPFSLAFLSLFGGIFSDHVFVWTEDKIKHVFALKQ